MIAIDLDKAEQDLRSKIAEAGLVPPEHLIADDKIHRIDADGKKGKKDGFYVLHTDGIPAGAFGDWHDRSGWQSWCAVDRGELTPAQRAVADARIESARKIREAEEERERAEAAERARRIWEQAQPAPPSHQYLKDKKVKPHGLRVGKDGWLVAPFHDADGTLHTIQRIGPDGAKLFLKGGLKHGCFFVVGKLADNPERLDYAEGFATAASIFEAIGRPVVVTGDCGNMLPVAESLRKKYPHAAFVFWADDDLATPGNPGLSAACYAAKVTGGRVVLPGDFNDLAKDRGPEVVKACGERETLPTETAAEPLTVCLAGIAPEKVTWLWTGRLAVGKITVLDGLPGSGKSTMTCDAAARVSRGLAFPNDRHARPAGGVIFVAGEDGVADTVVPRLLAAGADLTRCFVWPAGALPYLPDGAETIEREIQQRQARLLILDPVTALFARDLSTNSDQDVRLALTPIAVAAERLGCCVLMLRHLNKRSGASALDRGGGSVGIGALARVVLLVARDHSDPDLRILATVKANLTRPPRSLQARILDVDGVGKVAYGDECDVTADSLVSEPATERKGKTGDAADWLGRALADGQWHRQREIEAAAKEEGIAPHTLRRARESAGVTCRQREGGWWWRLPDAQPAPTGHVDTWTPGERSASVGQERINNNSRLGVPDSQASTPTHTPSDGHLADAPPPANDDAPPDEGEAL